MACIAALQNNLIQSQDQGHGGWGVLEFCMPTNLTHIPTELCSPGERFQLQEMVIGSEGSGKSRSCLALKVPELSWLWVFPIGWKSSWGAKWS